jgi:phage terminase large subunit-like protein
MTLTTIQIDVHPHQGQAEVHKSGARFKGLAAGRRWGKTRLGVNECLDVASQGGRAWWVAPSYKTSEVGWRPLRRIGGKIGAEIRKVDRQINLPGGGSVQVRSADDPNSLRGEGLDFVVGDEIAFMKEEAWTEALRPSLSDRQGKALFISTPKGRNWFWRMFQRGKDGDGEWASFQYPTSDNPYIAPDEIEAARRYLPERIFQQEYLAMFLDDAGGVFRRVMDGATAIEQIVPEDGHEYVLAVDWGQMVDFTVIIVLDITTKSVVFMDRFNQIDYIIQSERLKTLVNRYKPTTVIAEVNAMGQPIVERLLEDGLPIQPFTTTNATKAEIVRGLQNGFENGEIKILNDPILIGELQAYEQERTTSGLWKFGAPEGMHDDTVIALALAWWSTRTWYFT